MANQLISSLSDFSPQQFKEDLHTQQNPASYFTVKNCDIEFDLTYSRPLRFVRFENCRFLKKVDFQDLKVEIYFDFINCEFKDPVVFKNIKIKGKSRFLSSRFENDAKFSNVSFNDLADFSLAVFYEVVIFFKVDFFGTTVFTETSFQKNVLFTYSKIADIILFIRTSFGQGIDLSLAIITGHINIHSSDLLNFPDKKDIVENKLYRDAAENVGVITLNNKRETFRILKKHSKDDSNQFKFLEYSKFENEVYFKQLSSAKLKRLNNYVIFLLNKWSNDHNMSWLRGVVFTTVVGVLFFYSAILTTETVVGSWKFPAEENFMNFLGLYFNFLSPLHTAELFKDLEPNTWTVILDFFGRIFVGYGIYQTVQAFRKHKG